MHHLSAPCIVLYSMSQNNFLLPYTLFFDQAWAQKTHNIALIANAQYFSPTRPRPLQPFLCIRLTVSRMGSNCYWIHTTPTFSALCMHACMYCAPINLCNSPATILLPIPLYHTVSWIILEVWWKSSLVLYFTFMVMGQTLFRHLPV